MNNIFYKIYSDMIHIKDMYEHLVIAFPNKETVIEIFKNTEDLSALINVIENIRLLFETKNENLLLIKTCRDLDIQELAIEDTKNINKKCYIFVRQLNALLTHIYYTDNDSKAISSVILEIRAGTGGNEASIFAYELLQMYLKFIEKKKWLYKIINYSGLLKKSVKEAIVNIKGYNVYKEFRHENGVHRVQRIPETESQGRIHTSTCSVIAMPEENIQKISLNEKDIRIDVFRSSGPGGQSVNTTDSAVRILHIPTNIMVQCQNEKSQARNKITAINILKIKLQKFYNEKKQKQTLKEKRSIIGTADRSEKRRTYNFPQDRCTDHKFNITIQNLDKLFSGNLDELLNKIKH